MSNFERYNNVFADIFKVTPDQLNENFTAGSVEKWDSITHLTLVTAIEDAFDVMFDPEDILTLKSYDLGKEILIKYGVQL